MFRRFTERARQVVVEAQHEARERGDAGIRTEHLLIGILRVQDGLGAIVLDSLGVTLDDIRAQLGDVAANRATAATGQIPFSRGAKRALELALREALSLGHDYIGTEHVLLGLLRESDDTGARLLLERGVDAERVRDEVLRRLSRLPHGGASLASRPRRRRFEHRVELLPELSPERLDELSDDGWQVAGVVREEDGYRVVLRRPRR